MTIEQKAKAYDEALWKAGELYQPSDSALLEEIFPELIKYNDEKVRGAIIHFISHTPTVPIGRINKETMLTWLEKQGEPKPILPKWKYKNDNTPLLRDSIILNKYGCVSKSPSGALVSDVWVIDYDELAKLPKEENEMQYKQKLANKVKPKFKVGDWITDGNSVLHITNMDYGFYQFEDSYNAISIIDEKYHLWTIQDAKSGDVLACGKCILIFDQLSEFNNEQALMDICHCTSKGFYWQDTKDRDVWELDGFKPATKEQRDTLFAKMHEAGFEWDAERKELKIIDWNKHIKYEANSPSIIEENPAWSLDDVYMIKNICHAFEKGSSQYKWLKSLKDKVQPQPKQEWSKEDEKTLADACIMLDWYKGNNWWKAQYIKDWLKSIKQRMG